MLLTFLRSIRWIILTERVEVNLLNLGQQLGRQLMGQRNHRGTLNGVVSHAVAIGKVLGGLRDATGAPWAAVFQFHNGGIFINQHPQWRIACTHERAAPRLCWLGDHFSGVFVSRTMELVRHLFVSAGDLPHVQSCGKGVFVLTTDKMEAGFVRSVLEEGGVTRLIQGSLRDRHGGIGGFLLASSPNGSSTGSVTTEILSAATLLPFARAVAASDALLKEPFCS
jgi:hypothetical protein